MKWILNVGGGSRNLPPKYNGWNQDLLDIDENVKPDICCDAKEMSNHISKEYDVVYMSHTLEHFYKHDVPVVLQQCLKVLKSGGYIEIYVPNVKKAIEELYTRNLDIDDVWYRIGDNTPITYHDTIHGWHQAMSMGNLYYAHRCSFTPLSLCAVVNSVGFKNIIWNEEGNNLLVVGYKEIKA